MEGIAEIILFATEAHVMAHRVVDTAATANNASAVSLAPDDGGDLLASPIDYGSGVAPNSATPPTLAAEADGYSIDLARRVLANLGLRDTPLSVRLVDTNEAMLGLPPSAGSGGSDSASATTTSSSSTYAGLASAECNHTLSPRVLCLAAAAAPLRADAWDARVAYTHAFYAASLRALAPVAPDAGAHARTVVGHAAIVLGVALLASALIILLCVPLLWVSEMQLAVTHTAATLSNEGRMPLFVPREADAGRVLVVSLGAAVAYACRTFCGAQLPPPHTVFGHQILTPTLAASRNALAVLTLAALAATFARDAANTPPAGGDFADLSGRAVCVDSLSASTPLVMERLALDTGFRLVRRPGLRDVTASYLRHECDVAVHDEPLLRAELRRVRATIGTSPAHPAYERALASGIVPATSGALSRTRLASDAAHSGYAYGLDAWWAPYSLAMVDGHPLFRAVDRALVALATDPRVRADLDARWLHTPPPDPARGLGGLAALGWGALVAWSALVAVFGGGALAVLHRGRAHLVAAASSPTPDRGAELLRERHACLAPSDASLKSTHTLVHEVAKSVRAIDQSVHRMQTEQSQALTVMADKQGKPRLLLQAL